MTGKRSIALFVGLFVLISVPACGPRAASVGSSAAQPAQLSIQVNNTLGQSVNVYVNVNGTDTFLRQVAANSNVTIPVPNYSPGTTATHQGGHLRRRADLFSHERHAQRDLFLSSSLAATAVTERGPGIVWLLQVSGKATFTPNADSSGLAQERIPQSH